MTYRLREERRKVRMTQEELAEKSGISRVTISLLETHDEKTASTKTLLRLANALELPISRLFMS